MSVLPIACTLNAEDMAAVKARYQEMSHLYNATVHISDGHADAHLQGDRQPIGALLDEMVARESSCCSFLTFDVTEVDDGYRVRIGMEKGHELRDAILHDAVETFFPTAVVMVP